MLHVSKAFYLHMDPVFHCTSSPKWYSPASIYQASTSLQFSISSQIFIGTSSKHSLWHVLLPAAQAYTWAQVPAFVRSSVGMWKQCKLWRFGEGLHTGSFSINSFIFVYWKFKAFSDALVLQEWTLPWAWSAFKFPAVCEHGWPSSQRSHGDALPLVHIMPVLQWHNCEPLSLVGPSAPIIEPCKPATTFTLTSSAPHSSEALPFRAT